jgi:hypothetical protein
LALKYKLVLYRAFDIFSLLFDALAGNAQPEIYIKIETYWKALVISQAIFFIPTCIYILIFLYLSH